MGVSENRDPDIVPEIVVYLFKRPPKKVPLICGNSQTDPRTLNTRIVVE